MDIPSQSLQKKHLWMVDSTHIFNDPNNLIKLFDYNSFSATILSVLTFSYIMKYCQTKNICDFIPIADSIYSHIVGNLEINNEADCERFIANIMDMPSDRFKKVADMAIDKSPCLKEQIVKGFNRDILDCLLRQGPDDTFQEIEYFVFRYGMFTKGIEPEFLMMIGKVCRENILIQVLDNAKGHLTLPIVDMLLRVLSGKASKPSDHLNERIERIRFLIHARNEIKDYNTCF